MIKYLKLYNEQFVSAEQEDEAVKWICIEKPSEDEIHSLIQTYQLPPDYVTSILDEDETSRIEGLHQQDFSSPVLLLLQYSRSSVSPSGYMQLETFPCAIILTADKKILTITNEPTQFIQEIQKEPLSLNEMPLEEYLILHVAWKIAVAYNKQLKQIISQTNKLESELKLSTENNQLYQLMEIQKSLVYFESALTANHTVLNTLYGIGSFRHPDKHHSYLHDVIVETKQSLTTTKIQLKLVDKISDTFSAIVSNNLNNVMKILTSLTVVLTIPTIMGGIYGMNVKLPFADKEYAFWGISIFTLILCVWVIRKLRKNNLL